MRRLADFPLRLRLTLLSTALLAVVLAVFGTSAYLAFSSRQFAHVDDILRDRAAEIQRSARLHSGAVVLRELSIGLPGTYIQVIDAEGDVVLRSENLGDVTLPRTTGNRDVLNVAVGRQNAFFIDIRTQGMPELRMLVVPIRGSLGQPAGAVQIAVPIAEVESTVGRLRLVLILAGFGGLTLAAIAGWRTAYAALRPVEEIAGAAVEIGRTQDLTRRVRAGGADELGKLADAFNGMLDRLERAREELQRTLEGQKRFLADVSHELRTPLTTMRGNLEITLRDTAMAPEERASAIGDALGEAERMSRMVDDLLALARTGAAQEQPHTRVELAPLVRSAVEAARPRANGLALTLRIESEPAVDGDPDKLRRLMDNLLDNAVKYTPSGEIEILVRTDAPDAVIRVSDTGPGMSVEEASQAFERFWRGDRARGEPGSGLGLAIVRAVVEEHGGSIVLDSEPGAGSTFTVRLPGRTLSSESQVGAIQEERS